MNKINLAGWSKTPFKTRSDQAIKRAQPKHLSGTHTGGQPNAISAKSGGQGRTSGSPCRLQARGTVPAQMPPAQAMQMQMQIVAWLPGYLATRGRCRQRRARGARFSSSGPIIGGCGLRLRLGLKLALGDAWAESRGTTDRTRGRAAKWATCSGVVLLAPLSRCHPGNQSCNWLQLATPRWAEVLFAKRTHRQWGGGSRAQRLMPPNQQCVTSGRMGRTTTADWPHVLMSPCPQIPASACPRVHILRAWMPHTDLTPTHRTPRSCPPASPHSRGGAGRGKT